MLDKQSQYVKEYLGRIENLFPHFLAQDYSYLDEKTVKVVKEIDRGWKYRVVKDLKSNVFIKDFYSDELKSLIYDENILDVTIQSIPPNHFIDPHIDDKAHDKNVWRVLLPINTDNFILRRSGKTDVVEVGKVYEIDYTYEAHSSWNVSKTEPFVTWMFDIFYPDGSLYANKTVRGIGINSRTKMDDIDSYYNIAGF